MGGCLVGLKLGLDGCSDVCDIACAARRASGETVRRGAIVSRETHVHGAGVCFCCGLEAGVLLDSMNHRCSSMRFYDAKMGFYDL